MCPLAADLGPWEHAVSEGEDEDSCGGPRFLAQPILRGILNPRASQILLAHIWR